jgi:hypothetical protein
MKAPLATGIGATPCPTPGPFGTERISPGLGLTISQDLELDGSVFIFLHRGAYRFLRNART